MSESSEPSVNNDPFAPENVGAVQTIVLMRIYDVLLGIYREQNEEFAERLVELHEGGKVLGPLPWINLGEEQ